MERHFEEAFGKVNTAILTMGSLVEDQMQNAMRALIERDEGLARRVIENDQRVNALDLDIDEMAIECLARYQPAARDLRFLTTAMKISSELERMSDLAENICERAIELNVEPQLKPYIDIPSMAECAGQMVRESLDAFVKTDAELARKVIADDDVVDNLTEQVFRELLSFMIEDPRTITRAIRLSFISKYIERVADHATNIAELVVYLAEGKNIRHTMT
ncbi:MAG: phosphate signaling complex protein PhoU [Nitrospira sp.]|nr:phosphate signaling complex protein PhoU [Nitrospira sp.]